MNRTNLYRILGILAVLAIAYYGYTFYVATKTSEIEFLPDSVVYKRGCYKPDSLCLKIIYRFPVAHGLGSSRLEKVIVSDYLEMVDLSNIKSRYPYLKDALVNSAMGYDTSFVEYAKQFGSQSTWFINIDYKVIYRTSRLLSIRYHQNSYLGGAHNMYEYHYLIIDLKKSNKLALSDLITDKNRFTTIAQKVFTEQILNDTNDNTDYWLAPNNTFILPKEFGLTAKGILFHYNVYEIASYSRGDIELLIPYDDIKDILVEKYRKELIN
ncbi:DUF3298 and DUF4163 domain-containing protein [Tenuifilum thalassicum]|uniref:DUF3298 and DUF4163 domain-containing protein n=1 Tax=Tenuifilum thalassicum TaxID=2590900 RepID=A0A7D3XJE5_9BACT|nr:DUF3298 and DUF4163 domain-containing protein [Tenuifilum thalassicum]QKG78810.1 DUF3298 and DUF4163 domain-containing protein [Tenuifilum thalassicum]